MALVAALLISTNAAATTSAAATPAPSAPSRDTAHPSKVGTVSSRGDDDDGDMIVPAFVAAVTSCCCCCCCCPAKGNAGKGDDNIVDAAPTGGAGGTPARRAVEGYGASALGDGQQCSWCRVLHESQPEKPTDEGGHGHQGGRYHEQQQEEEEEMEAGASEEKVRSFVNSWSKVQSAVWHVNACLAALRLTTPPAAADDCSGGGASGGGSGGGGGRGGALSPVDPLRLRPALALALFRRRERLRRLCERRALPNPGGKKPSNRRQQQRQQRQQQQQQQQRAAAGTRAPRGGKSSAEASRNGSAGSAPSPRTATSVDAGEAGGHSEVTEREQLRRRRRHLGPLPCRQQRGGRCCRSSPYDGAGCAWAGRVREVLGAVGFAFPG